MCGGGCRRAGFRRSRREVPANGVLSCGKAVVRGLVGPSSGGPVERRSRRGGAVVRGLVEPLSGGPVAECRRTRAVVRGACVRSYCRAPAPPRQGTPAGYLSGSTWMAIIVPAPKRARRRCSMSTVSACEWATLIAPSTRTCTSMAIEAPMRRVRRLCGERISGLAVTIERISCSTSAGSDFSSSSPSPVRIRSSAILKMKTATSSAAIGSAIRHFSPRK